MSDLKELTVTRGPDASEVQHSSMRHLYRIGPLVLVAVGIAACLGARPLEVGEMTNPGPGLWPLAVAVVVAATAGILTFVDIPEDYEGWDRHSLVIAAAIAVLAIFIVLFQVLGFVVSSFLMLIVWLKIFARESWRLSLVLAIAGSIALYLVFAEFFGVPFPDGVLMSLPDMRS